MANSPQLFKPAISPRDIETRDNLQAFLDEIARTGAERDMPQAFIRYLQDALVRVYQQRFGDANAVLRYV